MNNGLHKLLADVFRHNKPALCTRCKYRADYNGANFDDICIAQQVILSAPKWDVNYDRQRCEHFETLTELDAIWCAEDEIEHYKTLGYVVTGGYNTRTKLNYLVKA